ncbi:AMP-binding protein [Crenobacter sp. SG2305]|uniref:AMP-binding protein n=1 Tax=Crenobacter oryzisoli TaxID=3056844 RepID=UPI0025AA52F2|nr:AMP-binding protein [Crenobacter sp. SG2305]MDN0082729.1 AMP-binding protein [Crenobacter sp. SG2305]
MTSYPLIGHTGPTQPLAYFRGRVRSAAQFLADAAALAERLPDGDAVFNACQNRYLFAVALAACVLRDKVCLLPASRSADSVAQLREEAPELCCVSDQPDGEPTLPTLQIDDASLAPDGAAHWPPPAIPAQQRVARLFTSGSTGQPQGHDKHWGEFVPAMLAGAARLGLERLPGFVALGTVPPQHMYGLESTVLRPLLCGGVLVDASPFFPADIKAELARLPAPRVLVSTPFHLHTLLESGLSLPELALMTSATAPLASDLAGRLEARFGAPLLEIYGSTETGQLATRRSAETEQWECLSGVTLREDGPEGAIAEGGHLWQPQRLNDRVLLDGARRFSLLGRNADLVNVAGKRSSLSYLTQQLLAVPGVDDGVFFLPEEEGGAGKVARLAALVVAPTLEREALLAALRERIDAAFLPRPLKFVSRLPRNAIGKLPIDALRAVLDGANDE